MNPFVLVLSDTHLAEHLPSDEPGMAHRKLEASFDQNLASLIDQANIRGRASTLDVVLNGDFFDLDAPPSCTHGAMVPDSLRHTEAGAADALCWTLGDHRDVEGAMARVLVSGGRVVFVAGNHDAALVLPGVQSFLIDRLASAASLYDGKPHAHQILIRSLFHRTVCGIHLEHGHLYDPLCAQSVPYLCDDGTIERTVGSVASYYAPAVLRDIDPYAVDPLSMRAGDMALSTWRSAVSGSPGGAWVIASTARFIGELAGIAQDRDPARVKSFCRKVSSETGDDARLIAKHADVFTPRATAAQALEYALKDGYGDDLEKRLRVAQGKIAKLYECRGVLFGHTHSPWIEQHDGQIRGNLGAWSRDESTFGWIEPNGSVSVRSIKDGPL